MPVSSNQRSASHLLLLYADVIGAFRECTSYSEISLQHTSLYVCFINELCIHDWYMNQWQKVERMLLKWLKSWTSNTKTVLCCSYCFTVAACCSLCLYFSRSKRSILKEFNSELLLLTYFFHTTFVAVRTMNWLQCLAAALVTSRCHSTFCSVTLHSNCAVARVVFHHPVNG